MLPLHAGPLLHGGGGEQGIVCTASVQYSTVLYMVVQVTDLHPLCIPPVGFVLQRCVVVHATDNLIVERNVAFDTRGHCYMVEEGGTGKFLCPQSGVPD